MRTLTTPDDTDDHFYVVLNRFSDDQVGRAEQRAAHREFLRGLLDEGVLIVAGPFDDDRAPGALVIIRSDSEESAGALMAQDPFYASGLVVAREIRRYRIGWGSLLPGESWRAGQRQETA